jgi:hypothetical protein
MIAPAADGCKRLLGRRGVSSINLPLKASMKKVLANRERYT